VGKCPLCEKDVVRNRYGYGCSGYREGCKFFVGAYICSIAVSFENMKLLLERGETGVIKGFVSKAGKSFDARLRLDGAKCVFSFEDNKQEVPQNV
jgi:DNA topoisomerase-3